MPHPGRSNAAEDYPAAAPPSGRPSDRDAADRIDQLHAAGDALDEVLGDAQRFASRESRRVRSRGRLVLFVDDSQDARDLGEAVLNGRGFHVEQATDGVEAVEKAAVLLPDVIVMDFDMPAMNGGEAARRLASDERTRSIPVVMVSGAAECVPREVRLGCAAFLVKPCPPEELATILHLIVAARGDTPSDPGLFDRPTPTE